MKKIVWLASYPKSGNTWFRAFLANLMRDPEEPVGINELDTGPIASARMLLDIVLGYDSANLTHEEVDNLRREWYLWQSTKDGPTLFLKVHDAYSLLRNGLPLFPPEATYGVLYIVRNPLDVCVSYAHHNRRTDCRATLEVMCSSAFSMCGRRDRFHEQLRQKMLSWSEHVASWVDAPNHRVHVMRYEDMKHEPEQTFTKAAKFLGLPDDSRRIRKAIEFSRFDELAKQEKKTGFRERLHSDGQFFRKGVIGAWRNELSQEQVEKIVLHHGNMMRRLGYLGKNGELLC